VRYLHLDWSLDELIGVYLSNSAPDQFTLRQEDVWLEISGLRGSLDIQRLVLGDCLGHVDGQSAGDHR
jgi:hypothetical protein